MSKIFSQINSFQYQTKKDWKKSIKQQNIQIKDLQHSLNNTLYDPIYFKEEIKKNYSFKKNSNWNISFSINCNNIKSANKNAIEAIENGAQSILFKLNKDKIYNEKKINELLRNIDLKKNIIEFYGLKNYDSILKYLKSKNYGKYVFHDYKISKINYLKYSKLFTKIKFQTIQVNKTDFNKIKNQIIDFISTKHIQFNFKLSNNYFFEIAKIRAFRIWFWANFKEEPSIYCFTNHNNNLKINPLIQTCIQSCAAIIGGCNTLNVVLKDNQNLGIKQQLILKHEAYFSKIIDPLHGSYYIEKITQSFLKKTNKKETVKNEKEKKFKTYEGINIKNHYTKEDIKNVKHLEFGSGAPPYLRGPYNTMYCKKKWTIRQYSGFSTAEESNKFYKKNLKAGQKGLSIAFDLPTHRGYDSDHKRVEGDVGNTGVAIDTVDDMGVLLKDIDLNNISVSMTMNGAVLPIMSFLIVHAEENNFPVNQLKGTIQNDILKEFIVRNTYIYPPKYSMRIIEDIFKYTSKKMPKFNSISVSGYHMLEAGASAEIELAYTLANGLEYIRTGLNAGLKIDEFAPRISFFWGIGMNHFMEIAKMRAARLLWAQIVKRFKPNNAKSMMLRTHCQTSGWSLVEQEPENNITRTCVEALAAIMGGTQSLHTNAFDEAIALPTDYSAKIARDTQIFLQKNSGICNTIDPLSGSYYLEKLTESLIIKSKKIINEIEELGGMSKAIEIGIPKKRIEEKAAQRQAMIDSNKNIIIGLNAYQTKSNKKLKIIEINNQKVRKKQIEKLEAIKKYRNEKIVQEKLKKITLCCKTGEGNLLALCVEAARYRATNGEISLACEHYFGRHKSNHNLISGIYSMEIKKDPTFLRAKEMTTNFAKKFGRNPRILIAKIGQDGHDRGANVISTSFSDIGFDVDIGPLFQTPDEISHQAIENDVHMIGISSLAGAHKTLIPKLIKSLNKNTSKKILIILGGIIPKKDYDFLHQKGVDMIFGPGTVISEAVINILANYINE